MTKGIIIDDYKRDSYGIGSRITFALISSPESGRRQITDFSPCRDYINDCLIAYFNEKNNEFNSIWRSGNTPVDTRYLRLAIVKNTNKNKETDNEVKNRIYSAKRIINMYEDLAEFPKKSVITKVGQKSNKGDKCWLLTGSKEWLKSSFLVSMVTFIFRIVVEHGGFENLTSIKEVENRFKELSISGTSSDNCCDTEKYLPVVYPKFRMLMLYYKDMFELKSTEFWYPMGRVRDWHTSGGIYSLCSFDTKDPGIDNLTRSNWEKFKQEYGEK